MKSRSTEKKRKGSRIQSFKKRKMKGGLGKKFDINKPTFQNYTDRSFTSSYACDFSAGLNPNDNDYKNTLKRNIMTKLTEFAFTNNSVSFGHTIQCCMGLKGHSGSFMSLSKVSRSSAVVNFFAQLGTKFLFDDIGLSGDGQLPQSLNKGGDRYATLFHIAAAWGNHTIIEILIYLMNIKNEDNDYDTDLIVNFDSDGKKVDRNVYTMALDSIKNNDNTNSDDYIKPNRSSILKSLYAREVTDNSNTTIQNNNYITKNDDPIRCELLIKQGSDDATVTDIPIKRIEAVNNYMKLSISENPEYEIVEDDGEFDHQLSDVMNENPMLQRNPNSAGGGGPSSDQQSIQSSDDEESNSTDDVSGSETAINPRYMPFMSKCKKDNAYKDGKFCPYIASGVFGTSSATSSTLVNTAETDFICKILDKLADKFKDSSELITRKIFYILAHYAFRDDQAAFNKILTCATTIYTKYFIDNTTYEMYDHLKPFYEDMMNYLSNTKGKKYTLLHIGAIYGNIKIVKPLLQLYSKNVDLSTLQTYLNAETENRPSIIECLYTRSDVKLDLFYGTMRKGTPSNGFLVQQLFNHIIAATEELNIDEYKTITSENFTSGDVGLTEAYKAILVDVYSKNTSRLQEVMTAINKVFRESWFKSKNPTLMIGTYSHTGTDEEADNKIYAFYIPVPVTEKLSSMENAVIATPSNVTNILAGVAIIPAAIVGTAVAATTYMLYKSGEGLVTAVWNGHKWMFLRAKDMITEFGTGTAATPTTAAGTGAGPTTTPTTVAAAGEGAVKTPVVAVLTDDERKKCTKLTKLAKLPNDKQLKRIHDELQSAQPPDNVNDDEVVVIEKVVKFIIIGNVAYDIRSHEDSGAAAAGDDGDGSENGGDEDEDGSGN